MHLVPGDPAELLLSQGGVAPDPAAVAELREKLGLDRPMLKQYLGYVGGLLKGDLGASLLDDHPVADEIALRLPRTLELIFAGELHRRSARLARSARSQRCARRAVRPRRCGAAGLALAVPVFVVGTIAGADVCAEAALGAGRRLRAVWRRPARHLVLLLMPACTIAIGAGAVVFRMTRASVLEVLARDYVRTARAKGLDPRRVLLHHVVRNALDPGRHRARRCILGSLLGGTVLVEFVFNWPGLSGRWCARSKRATTRKSSASCW